MEGKGAWEKRGGKGRGEGWKGGRGKKEKKLSGGLHRKDFLHIERKKKRKEWVDKVGKKFL